MTVPRRGLPRSALVLTGVVAVASAGLVAIRVPAVPRWTGSDLAAWAALAIIIVLLEQFWIEIPHGTERENFSLTDAPFAAALMLVRPSVLTLAVAVGAILGESIRRIEPLKIAFNVGQFVVGVTAAQLVFGAVKGGSGLGVKTWLAAVAGMAVYFLVNVTIVALVIAIVQGEPFRTVLFSSLGLSVLHWSGNVAIGVLAAVVFKAQPGALALLAIPLALSYFAYRSWIRGIKERSRMDEMATAAAEITAEGDLTARIPAVNPDEPSAHLAATLNRMLDRLESAFLRERRFMSEASHELKTPITICRGYLEVLRPDAPPQELTEAIDVLVDELSRMGRIVDDVTTLVRSDDPSYLQFEEVALERFLDEVAAKAAPLLDRRLRLAAPPSRASVRIDPQRLTQALINLIQNAAVHGPAASPVDLRARELSGAWRFEVSDHGAGVPAGEEDSVFRPFHRLDATRPGSGLGLAIVRGIAEAHGGRAGVENRPAEGATFWIEVPA
jgi:signal transduction histidine kinase